MNPRWIAAALPLLAVPASGTDREPAFPYERWTVGPPVLRAGPAGAFDDVAVKDPSIVFYGGKYHLFYTSKCSRETAAALTARGVPVARSRSGTGYVSAPSLEELNTAPHHNLSEIVGEAVIAPQVFYFRPQNLWYLVAHRNIRDSLALGPIYLTNPDIRDVRQWTAPKNLLPEPPAGIFWIDFRVICDDTKAHLFYTDHRGSLFRLESPLKDFPGGLYAAARRRLRLGPDHGIAETVLTERGEDSRGQWRLHEAGSVYHVRSANKYLALAEAIRPHPTRAPYWDSRNRFMFALGADRIEGPWDRAERHRNEFAGDPPRLFDAAGAKSHCGQVSHFTLLRPGFDESMEIDDFRLTLVFQAFDPSNTPDNFVYDDLPWEILVMRNH